MRHSRNPEPKKYAALIQEFKNLETQLKSLPKSRPRRRNSSTENPFHQYLLLLTSHRSLMASLQHERSSSSPSPSPPPSPPRLRYSDHAAVEEILCHRRAALSTGKLRGRRLFAEELSVDFDQSSSVSDPVEKVIVVEEEGETVVKEDEGSGRNRKPRRGGGYAVAMAWFGFMLILVTLGLASMSCNGKFLKENELFLVPT